MPSLPKLNIPIFNTPNGPLTGTTQQHLPLADITDGLLLFKDGGACVVVESTSLNFGLLSEREQEAVVAAYAALINSLSFSVQILIRTQRKDVSNYLRYLDVAFQKNETPTLTPLMQSYRNFVIETTKKRNVLGKRFFLIVPFSPLELGVAKSFQSFTKRSGPLPYTKDYVIRKAKIALFPKRDHLIRQGARLGLRLKQLDDEQLTNLVYDVYNPNIDTVRAKQTEEEMEQEAQNGNP